MTKGDEEAPLQVAPWANESDVAATLVSAARARYISGLNGKRAEELNLPISRDDRGTGSYAEGRCRPAVCRAEIDCRAI
jgi:hypothetical protein